ncbi:MAG: hypothetical protein H0S79_02680 [Anaerolineaceae bacterium]|nr:hypothetical protein [Anaerolineaceae bacterium]
MAKKAEPQENKKRPSILNVLFTRPERDTEYMSDLNSQLDRLDKKGRVKFVVGAIFGAIVFFAALGLILWIISLLMG